MRNASLADLEQLLRQQHSEKLDLVLPATKLRAKDGLIRVAGVEHVLTEDADGIPDRMVDPNGLYKPTDVMIEGLSAKLKIPQQYLRRMQSEAPDLFDANVNGWLHGKSIRRAVPAFGGEDPSVDVIRAADPRKFLFRAFRSETTNDGGPMSVARALLSDQFGLIENLDVLIAALTGIKAAGVNVDAENIRCDLSDRRMYMRVPAPEIFVEAPELLDGYRSPFDDPDIDQQRTFGQGGGQALERGRRAMRDKPDSRPIMFAGLDIRNSEVGQGQFEIVPVITVLACSNGMTVTQEAARRRHVGGRLEEGTIQWSADTVKAATELITKKTRDTVKAFLSREFLQATVDSISEQAGVKVRDGEGTIQHVAKTLSFSEHERKGVLDHFIRGGLMTAGGVMQAVTSFSQTVVNADRAHELDDMALRALEAAATR
jgi:hypothetical protein